MLSDSSTYINGSIAPTGKQLKATPPPYDEVYGLAAPDPSGAGPICETYIEDCKYSKEETRKYTASDGSQQAYPHSSWFGLGEDGVCTKGDAATQWLDCGIPCPAPFPMSTDDLSVEYGIGVVVFIVFCAALGMAGAKGRRQRVRSGKHPLHMLTKPQTLVLR